MINNNNTLDEIKDRVTLLKHILQNTKNPEHARTANEMLDKIKEDTKEIQKYLYQCLKSTDNILKEINQ